MARNNKLSRKNHPATATATELVTGPADRVSQRKVRRWTFQAHIELPDGRANAIHLNRLIIGPAKAAREACREEEANLRDTMETLRDSKIQVEATGHETISEEMVRQLQGYQDMAQIYHLALSLSAEEYLRLKDPDATLEQPMIEAKVNEYYMTAANTLREGIRQRKLQAEQQEIIAGSEKETDYAPGELIAKLQAEET